MVGIPSKLNCNLNNEVCGNRKNLLEQAVPAMTPIVVTAGDCEPLVSIIRPSRSQIPQNLPKNKSNFPNPFGEVNQLS